MASRLSKILFSAYRMGISPFIHWIAGPTHGCRFIPTCSQYSQEAIEQYGFFRGIWLAIKRISRCHPFSRAGYDPVPHGIEPKSTPI